MQTRIGGSLEKGDSIVIVGRNAEAVETEFLARVVEDLNIDDV